jgi:septal ring factor EnvC (AmiA/AmiB activator)
MRRLALAVALFAAAPSLAAQQRSDTLPPSAARAAERIRSEQAELERLRQERATLERRMRELQSSARNITAERQNLERQATATARVVRSLDDQLSSLFEEVSTVNSSLVRTQDELAVKKATLRRRVNEIYKRGPLYTLEALLSAESFGALVGRYKYLHLVAKRDRALLERVQSLNQQVTSQRFLLVRLQSDVESNRREKADEEARLRRLEMQRGRTLAQVQAQSRQAQQRLQQVVRDEQRLSNVIEALEASRRRAEAAGARSGAPAAVNSLTTADLGRLDWPVDGNIVYRFGRVMNANNTSITWRGIGIGAAMGSSVKAVADGEVVFAEPFGTYGNMLMLQHGGGAYSVYASLDAFRVRKGQRVKKGDVIGTVGQADPDMPPHLHFEIRPIGRGPVDPLDWLRRQR